MEAREEKPSGDPNVLPKGMERIGVEAGQAHFALFTAAELLEEARKKSEESKFNEAIALSRDSVRMASSAILFRDGYVASDFSSSYAYLSAAYGDRIPVAEWKAVENLSRSSVVDRIGAIFGLSKGQLENDARMAMELAEKFIKAADALMGPIPEGLLVDAGDMALEKQDDENEDPGHEEADSGRADDVKGEAS